jgi:hypothetical protein
MPVIDPVLNVINGAKGPKARPEYLRVNSDHFLKE